MRTTGEWLSLCEQLEIPACKVRSIEDLEQDVHLRAVGLFQDVDHPNEGRIRCIAAPVLFDGVRGVIGPAPQLGQNNDELLGASSR